MNWIRKTIFIIGLSITLLLAFSTNEITVQEIQLERSDPSVSVDSSQSSDFIQPQVSNTFTSHHKTTNYSFANYLENFLIAIPDFNSSKFHIRFTIQDINRCEMVSLLLFPFHFFW